MKDITRIHIAKTAYDIELVAKKELEKYISALEHYAEDKETLDDIEIRITELLAEQKVLVGGVITSDDVAAVRTRLGEPSAFAPDDANGAVAEAEQAIQDGKRVYRDIDNALVGGVLAGIARYFNIDSLWVRLIFIVLLIPSFGTFVLVYAILWMIVPPAKTAAQKLQSRGKPVTIESIKSLAEHEKVNEVAKTTRGVLRHVGGIMLVLGGLGTLAVTGFTAFGIFALGYEDLYSSDASNLQTPWFVAAIFLFAISGVLLSILQFLLANATLRKVWNKKTSVAVVAVIAAGLVTFATGVGSIWYGSWQENSRIRDLYQTSAVDLDKDFSKIKTLTVSADDAMAGIANVEYVVSDSTKYELYALPGTTPKFDISKDGTSATLRLGRSMSEMKARGDYSTGQPALKVYGPALDNIVVKSGQTRYYNDAFQDTVRVEVINDSFTMSGTYKNINIDAKDSAAVNLEDATIENLSIKMAGSDVSVGVVRTLVVSQPEACPVDYDNSDENSLRLRGVSTDKFTYNGSELSAKTIKKDCGSVTIDKSENWEDEYDS